MFSDLKILIKIVFFQIVIANISSFIFAQSQKGVTPVNDETDAKFNLKSNYFSGSTRAVVIGISDYKDQAIPDLKYADKDARVFVEWLRSNGGRNIQEDNIQLLTNEHATRAQFNAALDWLMDECKDGDQAIIYFSGHGDVETRTKYNRGFFLCFDSPPNNYPAGAYSLNYLQDVITTLAEKKVRTVVITDACHAGKLAGGYLGGSQATTATLAKQYANEIKILSCQPDEFSIEGELWGGGRGVFSFYLVNGLYGFADLNSDGVVNLLELSRHLQDWVSKEVDPLSQIPMVNGKLSEIISRVDKETFAYQLGTADKSKSNLTHYNVRGLEDMTLQKVDSQTRKKYYDFKAALVAEKFFPDSDVRSEECAESLYLQLQNCSAMKPLHAMMKRSYAAYLQDVVQKALNALLADDPFEFNNWYFNPKKYAEYPKYLERAMNLLGERHYSYPLLNAQKKIF